MSIAIPAGMQISAPVTTEFAQILSFEALSFIAQLHRAFAPRRRELLALRVARAETFWRTLRQCVRAIGAWRRFLLHCNAVAWKSQDLLNAK